MIGTHRTTVSTTADSNGRWVTRVVYHDTTVVEVDRDRVTLRDGGWPTATTVRRMNQTSEDFGLGYRVIRHKGYMYCLYRGHTWLIGTVKGSPDFPYTLPVNTFTFVRSHSPHVAGCRFCTPVKGIKHDG